MMSRTPVVSAGLSSFQFSFSGHQRHAIDTRRNLSLAVEVDRTSIGGPLERYVSRRKMGYSSPSATIYCVSPQVLIKILGEQSPAIPRHNVSRPRGCTIRSLGCHAAKTAALSVNQVKTWFVPWHFPGE